MVIIIFYFECLEKYICYFYNLKICKLINVKISLHHIFFIQIFTLFIENDCDKYELYQLRSFCFLVIDSFNISM